MSDFDSIQIETLKVVPVVQNLSIMANVSNDKNEEKNFFFSTKKENILNKIEVFKDGARSFCQ